MLPQGSAGGHVPRPCPAETQIPVLFVPTPVPPGDVLRGVRIYGKTMKIKDLTLISKPWLLVWLSQDPQKVGIGATASAQYGALGVMVDMHVVCLHWTLGIELRVWWR